MFEIRFADEKDISVWLEIDRHITREKLLPKISNRRCYLVMDDSVPVGVMRYNLFWDSIPFLTLIYFIESYRGKGYGKQAMRHWEDEMRSLEFKCVMTSTQADENAQFFYRKLGYKDTGCLLLDIPGFQQPLEIFMIKEL